MEHRIIAEMWLRYKGISFCSDCLDGRFLTGETDDELKACAQQAHKIASPNCQGKLNIYAMTFRAIEL